MLHAQTARSHCDTGNSISGLQEAVLQWREVGERGDADACKAMINSDAPQSRS